jgi:hypothetical protein
MVTCICHPSYTGSINRLVVQASLGIKQDPNSKISRAKRAVGVALMVEL